VTRAELTGEVLDAVRRLRVHPIEPTLESRVVEDLGFDSMSVLELCAEVEERFDITVPLNDLPQIRTVHAMVDYVARARGAS
jgi:acyl carrier protein